MKNNKDKEIDEIVKNLEEQGLIKINPHNPDEIKLTEKGLNEVIRWKRKNKEMDFLLFLFYGTYTELNKIFD